MKKADLQKLIRENITSILKEDSYKSILLAKIKDCSLSEEEKAKMIADLENGNKIPEVAAKLEAATGEVVKENGELSSLDFERKYTKDFKEYNEDYIKGYNDGFKDYKMGSSNKFKELNEETEDEDDASEFEKEPTAKDLKKGDSITINATKLGEITKELKATVGLYKKSEGKEKQKHLDKLKDLTKLKKELEGAL